MAMQTDTDSQQRAIVEHFRATGYEGREPWIASIDPVIGSRIVAIRQFEACASRPACAWRDGVDDEIGLWGFMRDCLLENLESFARIIEATLPEHRNGCRDGVDGSEALHVAWTTVCRLLGRLRNAAPPKASYAETAVAFLVAVMALRQIVDAEVGGAAVERTYFSPYSTNVHPEFLPGLLAKLGSTRIDLSGPVLLPELTCRLEAWSRNGHASGD